MESSTAQIPLVVPSIGEQEQAAVARVLASGMLAQGPEVAAFEEEFSAHVDGRTCVAVSSGTAALHLGLLAAGIGPGDEVVVPSFTFAATANAVALTGATPVFADVEATSFCLDPAAVAAAVTPRTAAVLAVHLYGHPADVDALGALARRRGLLLLEDAAQAHLATWGGRAAGALGDVGAFSFYPTKNMTSGEGGMVVLRDEEQARRVRLLRNQGMLERYRNEVVGFNLRMTDLHAAIGRVQLRDLPARTAHRRRNAAALTAALVGTPGVTAPVVRADAEHAWHQYTVRCEDRDTVVERLRGRVGHGVYYPVPVHRLPAFDLDLDLPVTDRLATEVVSLPVGPHLGPDDPARIAAAVAGQGGAARPTSRTEPLGAPA